MPGPGLQAAGKKLPKAERAARSVNRRARAKAQHVSAYSGAEQGGPGPNTLKQHGGTTSRGPKTSHTAAKALPKVANRQHATRIEANKRKFAGADMRWRLQGGKRSARWATNALEHQASEQQYGKYMQGLWNKVKGKYGGGEMPKLKIDTDGYSRPMRPSNAENTRTIGGTASVRSNDPGSVYIAPGVHLSKSSKYTDARARLLKRHAAAVPLHEWEHVAQRKRGNLGRSRWRVEGGAEDKEQRVARSLGIPSVSSPEYDEFARRVRRSRRKK